MIPKGDKDNEIEGKFLNLKFLVITYTKYHIFIHIYVKSVISNIIFKLSKFSMESLIHITNNNTTL